MGIFNALLDMLDGKGNSQSLAKTVTSRIWMCRRGRAVLIARDILTGSCAGSPLFRR